MSDAIELKALDFIGSSREDMKAFPEEVRQDMGYALFEAQRGQKPAVAKPLQGFGGAVVYVLHCFQKKAKHGIKTPQQDIELIKQRLQMAEQDYETHYRGQ